MLKPPLEFGSVGELLKLSAIYNQLDPQFLDKFIEPTEKHPLIENLH